VTDLPDDELLELERLLQQSLRRSAALKRVVQASRTRLSEKEISEDYTRRLADKALFRQLLEDNSLDGMRFRWLFSHLDMLRMNQFVNIDALRAWIDRNIQMEEKERERGPAS
jgi:hypothetical protein